MIEFKELSRCNVELKRLFYEVLTRASSLFFYMYRFGNLINLFVGYLDPHFVIKSIISLSEVLLMLILAGIEV